jgi:hypothetical protein
MTDTSPALGALLLIDLARSGLRSTTQVTKVKLNADAAFRLTHLVAEIPGLRLEDVRTPRFSRRVHATLFVTGTDEVRREIFTRVLELGLL